MNFKSSILLDFILIYWHMLVLLSIWCLISIILWSLGDILITIYRKLGRHSEQYTMFDTFILGICTSFIILGFLSLWIPINVYITLGLFLISIVYIYVFRLSYLREKIQILKREILSLSKLSKLSFALFLLGIIIYNLVNAGAFDAVNYHYQQTAWNEQFAVVPGLANLESRFGFNSNHLLLSALFSFSKQLGEPLYGVQSLLSLFFGCWIFCECLKTRYSFSRVLLLGLYVLFYLTQYELITNSSTDIIPSLIIFYIGAKLIFYSNTLKQSTLLYGVLPIALITIKISILAIIFFSIYIYFLLLKDKEIRSVLLLLVFSLLILTPWLIRNVIISGYLVYPIYWFDIFTFDWEIPKFVAELEQGYIKDFAWARFYENITFKHLRNYLEGETWIFFQLIFRTSVAGILSWVTYLSPIFLAVFFKRLNKDYLILYCTVVCIILVSFLAPDFRFVAGAYYVIIFLLLTVVLGDKVTTLKTKYIPLLVSIILCFGALKSIYDFYMHGQLYKSSKTISSLIVKPCGPKALLGVTEADFSTYQLGDHTIYLSNIGIGGITYDILPATFVVESRDVFMKSKKFLPLEAIEARGEKLSDGFKPVKEVEQGWWIRKADWWDGH